MTMRYDRPVWRLMLDAANDMPEVFETATMMDWFGQRYPLIHEMTVRLHLRAMSVNVPAAADRFPDDRKVFYKLDRTRYTKYDEAVHGVFERGLPLGETTTASESPNHDSDLEVGGAAPQFALEAHLEEFMEANWGHLDFGRSLRIYRDDDGAYGRQFRTSVGTIDFLCVDSQSGDFHVLELKRGSSSDRVVGQTLRYMGWVEAHLAHGKDVRGLIIAHDSDEQLRYALRMVPKVDAWTYQVNFTFNREGLGV